MPAPLPDEELARRAALVREHGSIRAAARAMGIDFESLRRSVKRAAERGLDGSTPGPAPEGFIVTENRGRFDRAGNLVGQSVATRREPGEVFVPLPDHLISGESALTDPDGRVIVKWMKTARDAAKAAATIETIRAAFAGQIAPAPPVPAPSETAAELLTLYPAPDLHLGQYSWGEEAGADYDLEIATRHFRAGIGRLMAQTPTSAVAVLLGLGDLTHADNEKAATPRSGHKLELDTRHAKVRMAACRLWIWAIERALAKHGTVLVRLLPGNHDPETALAITLALALRYEEHARVEVDIDPSLFWFHRWGDVLMGAHHGHTMKPAQMPAKLATARRADWGQTRYARFYFGHFHHGRAMIEEGGVRVEQFGTMAPHDANAAGQFIPTERSLCAITHHLRQPDFLRCYATVNPALGEVEELAA